MGEMADQNIEDGQMTDWEERGGEQRRSVFVFGSNREGRHGAGAALSAVLAHGAIYGQAEGLQGASYAIVTKELRQSKPPVTLAEVAKGVDKFIRFASIHPHLEFNVTKIGCGLAGFREEQIAPLFKKAPENCNLPDGWRV